MPLRRVECADPALRKEGRRVFLPTDKCLDCALTRNNGCNYTYEVLKAMYGADQTEQRGDNVSTTTLLTSCPRQTVLERKTDFIAHPDDLWAAFKGTLTHEVLRDNIGPGDWGEVRVWARVPDTDEYISCRPDLVSPRQGILWDYKTAKRIPNFGHIWPNQEAQLQINRWIIDHAVGWGDEGPSDKKTWSSFGPEMRPQEWTSLRIVYITDETMAVHEVTKRIRVPNKTREGEHTEIVPDIWSDEQVLDYMMPRWEELTRAFAGWPEHVPPIPEEIGADAWGRKFPCGWCPVRDECKRLALEENR